jgi:hypothetical protein
MSRRKTKLQMLREIADLQEKLRGRQDVGCPVPAARIGQDADCLPMRLKAALIRSYTAAGLTQVENINELPGLSDAEKAEILAILSADQFQDDPPG